MVRRYNGLSFYQRKKLISGEKISEAMSWIFIVAVAILLAFFLVFTMGMRTTVIGTSMEPALYNGQVVFLNRVVYNILQPSRGDVIAFRPNGNVNAHYSVKRVVAVPGDKVQILDGVLYLNGERQDDMFDDLIADAGVADDLITLEEDEYFVMGDNCNSSEDSRSVNLGNVKKDYIVGKVWLHMAGGDKGIGRVN
ncbi:signal peptidase I [Lachnospiraceae bacterium]|nr:signal peptidase I [Lachnospiraceae bacterium]